MISSRSPIDGAVIGVYRAWTADEVRDACRRARCAGERWRERPWRERRRLLDRLRAVLLARSDALAAAITREIGKPIVESYSAEILPTLAALRDLPGRAERLLRPSRPTGRRWGRREARLEMTPFGVIGVIGTWNYPLFLSLPVIASALAAGNAVVWKPSELALDVAERIGALLEEAGVPAELVQILPGGAATGRALVEAACDKYLFIGGRETGREVLAAIGRRLRPAVAELSGNDAMIVCDDAPLELAAAGAVWGRMLAAGQTCVAPRRIYVAASLYPRFLEHLQERVSRLRVGDPRRAETEVGPLRTEQHRRDCARRVGDAVERGARVLAVAGGTYDGDGCFFPPTLLADVPDDAALMREDLYGPVLCVRSVADDAEAMRRATGGDGGEAIPALTVSIWTRDRCRAMAMARRLRAGVVTTNEVVLPVADAAIPFGGQGESGYGRLRGDAGFLEFVQTRTVVTYGSRHPRHPYRACQPAGLVVVRAMALAAHGSARQRVAGLRALALAVREYRR